MTTATVYILLSNDGEQDFILTSDKLLHTRLKRIRASNIGLKRRHEQATGKRSFESVEAQIADVTETHNLWIHRRFHPYVALAHTFIPTQIFSGSINLRSGGAVQFDLEYAGEFYNKACLHVKLTSGAIALDGSDAQYWSWAPMPGHKFIKDVEWRVNTSNLDKYDNHFMNSNFEFEVTEDQKPAYLRCVGQQQERKVRIDQFESAITATGGVLGTVGYDEEVSVTDGPQTRKVTHEAFEMFVPLQFWWNYQSEESFSVLTVPNGQRIVKYNLEKLENMVQFYDKDGAAISYDVSQWSREPSIETIEMLVQNIYINPEINDIYIDRIGFNMVRLHRYQDFTLNSAKFNERLNLFKWPIEEIRYAARPRDNEGDTRVEDWNSYSVIDPTSVQMAGRWHGDPSTAITTALTATDRKCYDIFKTITLTIQGLKLYDEFPARFFQDFTPHAFSTENNRRAPVDACGWGLINFAEKPGHSEATGHINVSRVRETYLSGSVQLVGPGNDLSLANGSTVSALDEAVIHVEGIAINFTFVTNGNKLPAKQGLCFKLISASQGAICKP